MLRPLWGCMDNPHRPLRACLVTETFPPEINGVAMTLGRLTAGWVASAVATEVVAPYRADRQPAGLGGVTLFEVRGLPIPRYPGLRFGLPCRCQLQRRWQLQRPDWVHVATEGPLGWSAVRAARRLGIPVVSSYHTHFASYSGHYGVGIFQRAVGGWLRYLHNQTSATFVPTAPLAADLTAGGYHGVEVMGRGVDCTLFSPRRRDAVLRSRWGAGPVTPVAIHVGRLAAEKNLDATFGLWCRMRQTLPDLRFVVVGDGPERARLERTWPEVHFAGMQRGEQLARHYASADCFLFASTTETYGNVVPEALASGLVVVGYDYAAAAAHVRDGISGFTAPLDDSAALLKAASRAAAAYRSGDWPTIGAAARTAVEPHSWTRIVDDYLAIVRTLISR
jgi:glycosyltransferase involved in cell wall biosynthesis